MWRTRLIYAIGAAVIVAVGLLWRSGAVSLSPFLKKYGGDALWALMVYFIIRFLAPQLIPLRSAAIALLFALTIELSQLYHAPWIDALRNFRLGALILGSTFNWPDLPAYAVGIIVGWGLETVVGRLGQSRPRLAANR